MYVIYRRSAQKGGWREVTKYKLCILWFVVCSWGGARSLPLVHYVRLIQTLFLHSV